MTASDICDIQSESAVISSVLINPSYTFFSEQLKASYFTLEENKILYFAAQELAKNGIGKADAYNIMNILSHPKIVRKRDELLNTQLLDNLFENAPYLARTSPEDYKKAAESVIHCAFRRDTLSKLDECRSYCFSADDTDIEKKIYTALDDVMMSYSVTGEVPQYKDEIDKLWGEIEERQKNGGNGIPFKFPTLNNYCTIEPGEFIVFAARAKAGKSMMLLNEAADLIKKGYKVLYIDSELSSRMFTLRLVANLTGIEYRALKDGVYHSDPTAEEKVRKCIEWIKTRSFTHVYMPSIDNESLYALVRKVYHTQGIDVLIYDYLKAPDGDDAFSVYNRMGSLVDLIKNKIAGAMNIAALGAAQLNTNGKLADSDKICRNASTIATIESKSPEEMETDGYDCGNMKLRITYNRNGNQMTAPEEYIDLCFEGNHIRYTEASQHNPEASMPY